MFRKYERTKLDCYVNKIIGDEPYMVRIRDISMGGVSLYTLLEPEAEEVEEVGLEMQLPDTEDVIWAVGQVVRDEDGRQAIRFKRMSENDRELIRAFVERRRRHSAQEAAA